MDKYADFIKQIPGEIMQNVEKYFCSNIALFKPSTFIKGITMHSDDFHIIIPSVPPPDTYISNKLQSFEAGKIVTINPGETILCPTTHRTKQYTSLLVKPMLLNKVAEEMELPNSIRFSKLQNPYSKELIQIIKLFDKESHRLVQTKLMLDCLAIQIAAILLREFKMNSKTSRIYLPDSDSYVALAIEYMETFYSSNITIEDICSEVNVSPFHFIRTFKQKTSLTPHQYLMKIRIKKAEELLCSREYTIAEVAKLCGFISYPHFSNSFKVMTGHSPSEYKRLFFYK